MRMEISSPSGSNSAGRAARIKNDTIYVGCNRTRSAIALRQGRIGSVKDGKVTAFIPVPSSEVGTPESISVDGDGVIYAGYTNKMSLRRFVKN